MYFTIVVQGQITSTEQETWTVEKEKCVLKKGCKV